MNFFSLCVTNGASLERRFDDYTSSLSETEKLILIKFASVIEREGRIAINMRPTSLVDFLASDRFFNIYTARGMK